MYCDVDRYTIIVHALHGLENCAYDKILIIHSNKSKISYTFVPKEICRKHYIIEQISGSLHEIQLYNVHFMYIFCYRKFNFFCSDINLLQYMHGHRFEPWTACM